MKKLILFYTLSLVILFQVAVSSAVAGEVLSVKVENKIGLIYHPDITDLLDPSYPRIA